MSPDAVAVHIVTIEYPPERGGVADYTANLVAEFRRRGVVVDVWYPQPGVTCPPPVNARLHPLVGGLSLRNLWRLHRGLNRSPQPRTLLVQYVPHGFGWKAMNLPFAFWLLWRARITGDRVETMFHEVAYPWVRRPLHHNLIAMVNRMMAFLIAHASTRLFVTIPTWAKLLRSYAIRLKTDIRVLPVPSNIPRSTNAAAVELLRSRHIVGPVRFLVGHFGTYGTIVATELEPCLTAILAARADVHLLLLGTNGIVWRAEFVAARPAFADRIAALGDQTEAEIADGLAACDMVIQPYPDGASCRRTTLMAALVNGRAVVTTTGPLSEPVWSEGAVAAVPVGDPSAFADAVIRCLDDGNHRAALERDGIRLYNERFTMERTVDVLLAKEIPTP